MIFSSLKDRLKALKKPFQGAVKRLAWRGEKAIQQMENRYGKESAVTLKDQIKGLIEANDLSGNKVDTVIQNRKDGLQRRLAPLLRAAKKYPTLVAQIEGIRTRIEGKLNALQTKFQTLLIKLNIKNKTQKIIKKNRKEFQKLADEFLISMNAAAEASTPSEANTKSTSKPVEARTESTAPSTKPEESPQEASTKATEAISGRYEINEAFKTRLSLKFYKFTRVWSRESWIPGGPVHNDGITRFSEEFFRNLLLTAEANNTDYRGYKGQEAAYAFVADMMGGVNSSNPNNLMKGLVQKCYIPFERYGRARRDNDPGFQKLLNSKPRDAYTQLISEFFSSLTIGIDGKASSSNPKIQKAIDNPDGIDKEEKKKATNKEGSKETQKTSKKPGEKPETVEKFNDIFQQLRRRGVSAPRFNNFMSRYKTDEQIRAQLAKVLITPENEEVYLDTYDEGLAKHFEVNMFRRYRILPNAWKTLPKIYETIRTNHDEGVINKERFTLALRNSGTDAFPRIFMNDENAMIYMNQAGGTNTHLGLNKLQSKYLNSSLNGLKKLLDTANAGRETLISPFELKDELYLDSALSFKDNAQLFHFNSPQFLQDSFDIAGESVHQYDIAWNSTKSEFNEEPVWKAQLETQLKAYHITLDSVTDDVKVKDVFDHAAQFMALVESHYLDEQGNSLSNKLDYNISGIQMTFDKNSINKLQVRQYFTRVISHDIDENPQKKIEFAVHLYEKFSAAQLNFSPDTILVLLEDLVKPLRLNGSDRRIPIQATSLEVFADYLSLEQNVNGEYIVLYRGEKRNDIALDQKMAKEYFHDMDERGENATS